MGNVEMSKELEAFNDKVAMIKSMPGYEEPIMFGLCKDVISLDGRVLESKFIHINVKENYGSAAIMTMVGESIVSDDPSYKLHDTDNECVYRVTEEFVNRALSEFVAFQDEVECDKHPNIQALLALHNAMDTFANLDENQQRMIGLQEYRFVTIYRDAPVETVESAYLKLTALSEGKSAIRTLNLDGVFGILTNCAWLINGHPVAIDELRNVKMKLIASGEYPEITHIDKFPRMLQHILPADNTRILDTSRVRMGAQLAGGTTVMPGASYINFNAGTEGPVMVEGRVSSSAIVGSGSDIGGGASILGVLSGTDGNPITVGENCLLGANSVCGIPLGNDCIIDAGIAILEGTKITMSKVSYVDLSLVNDDMLDVDELADVITDDEYILVKGSMLSGLNGMHFRQYSETGTIVVNKSVRAVELNEDLH